MGGEPVGSFAEALGEGIFGGITQTLSRCPVHPAAASTSPGTSRRKNRRTQLLATAPYRGSITYQAN